MPYAMKQQGNSWLVYNKDTGKEHGKHMTREKAMAQMRLLHMVENDKGGKH